jgi:hypothetical protein
MSGHSLVLFFQALATLGAFLTVYKLLKTNLKDRYRAFFWYFVFRIVDGLFALVLPVKSAAYFYCWILSAPIIWTFYLLVVRELYGLVLQRHKGMYTLGRWLMYFSVILSVCLSISSFLLRLPKAPVQRSQWIVLKGSILGYIVAINRGITFSLALVLVLMVFLLSLYAVTLSRNVKIHAALFACLFLTNSIGAVLHTAFGLKLYDAVDTGLMGISSLCTFAWFFLLTPKGEEVRRPLPTLGPKDEGRILYQLDALNSTLMKVAKK